LHDRFVLSDDKIIILGHGLKNICNKESFIICLDKELAGDVLTSVRASFEAKWQNAVSFV
jgi:hypothetical protein